MKKNILLLFVFLFLANAPLSIFAQVQGNAGNGNDPYRGNSFNRKLKDNEHSILDIQLQNGFAYEF